MLFIVVVPVLGCSTWQIASVQQMWHDCKFSASLPPGPHQFHFSFSSHPMKIVLVALSHSVISLKKLSVCFVCDLLVLSLFQLPEVTIILSLIHLIFLELLDAYFGPFLPC